MVGTILLAPRTKFVFAPAYQYKLQFAAFTFVLSTVQLKKIRELVDKSAGIAALNTLVISAESPALVGVVAVYVGTDDKNMLFVVKIFRTPIELA